MLQSKSDFIKISVIYLMKFIIILFLNPYLSCVISLAVFIAVPGISSTVYVNLVNGICGGIIELILLFFVHNNSKSGKD